LKTLDVRDIFKEKACYKFAQIIYDFAKNDDISILKIPEDKMRVIFGDRFETMKKFYVAFRNWMFYNSIASYIEIFMKNKCVYLVKYGMSEFARDDIKLNYDKNAVLSILNKKYGNYLGGVEFGEE